MIVCKSFVQIRNPLYHVQLLCIIQLLNLIQLIVTFIAQSLFPLNSFDSMGSYQSVKLQHSQVHSAPLGFIVYIGKRKARPSGQDLVTDCNIV